MCLPAKKFQWLDHTSLSYKNWEDSSDLSPVDTCVALHLSTGQWLKVSCVEDTEHGVVCQAPGGKSLELLSPQQKFTCITL